MTTQEIKAFWEGIAVANVGSVTMAEVVKEREIVNIDFDKDYQAIITMSDGTEYTITSVNKDSYGRITKIYITDGQLDKYLDCIYDNNGYLIKVGHIEVEDVSALGISVDSALQSKTVTPTAGGLTVKADDGYDGLKQVIVNGDTNLIAANVISGKTIFGVAGSAIVSKTQEKTATPGKDSKVVTPDSGYTGLSKVTVNGDNNLIPENIKKDVVIFGVTGEHQGGGGAYSILQAIDFTETKADATMKNGNTNEIIPTYTEGKITSATINGDIISVVYDSNGYLTKVNGIDVSGIQNIELPLDGDTMKF